MKKTIKKRQETTKSDDKKLRLVREIVRDQLALVTGGGEMPTGFNAE